MSVAPPNSAVHKIAARSPDWRPKLVISDLDGTLISHQHGLSEPHREMMQQLSDRGVPVIPATGRGPRLLKLTRKQVGGDGFMIMGQGGVVFDGVKPIHVDSMSATAALSIIDVVASQVGEVRVGAEDAGDFSHPLRLQTGFHWPYSIDFHEFVDSADVVRTDVLKLFIEARQLDIDDLVAIIREVLPAEVAEVTHSGIGFAEISPPGVDKARGVAFVAERLQIAQEDILCFGDMPNDLAMFAWCGRSVAMGDAHATVIAGADAVTTTCDDFGFSRYIEDAFVW